MFDRSVSRVFAGCALGAALGAPPARADCVTPCAVGLCDLGDRRAARGTLLGWGDQVGNRVRIDEVLVRGGGVTVGQVVRAGLGPGGREGTPVLVYVEGNRSRFTSHFAIDDRGRVRCAYERAGDEPRAGHTAAESREKHQGRRPDRSRSQTVLSGAPWLIALSRRLPIA